ncbi:MAG: hypothetical protein R2856_37865 [Caldilineaceae bacterium]
MDRADPSNCWPSSCIIDGDALQTHPQRTSTPWIAEAGDRSTPRVGRKRWT